MSSQFSRIGAARTLTEEALVLLQVESPCPGGVYGSCVVVTDVCTPPYTHRCYHSHLVLGVQHHPGVGDAGVVHHGGLQVETNTAGAEQAGAGAGDLECVGQDDAHDPLNGDEVQVRNVETVDGVNDVVSVV